MAQQKDNIEWQYLLNRGTEERMTPYVFWRVYISEHFKALVFSLKDILIYVQIRKNGLESIYTGPKEQKLA